MNEFKLIEGEFNAADAKEVLFNLLDDKISFHHKKMFSHEERFGNKDHRSLERLKALKENKIEIAEFLEKADKDERLVKIDSSIQII
ncbi:MAG: hypothetical protein ACI9QN_002100 [Arcticibacterium sp.]|jgi:hypothetical protein